MGAMKLNTVRMLRERRMGTMCRMGRWCRGAHEAHADVADAVGHRLGGQVYPGAERLQMASSDLARPKRRS
jgi:hypothetical protein